ncbi:MAG: ABC transporter permease [Acidipila sp.]|nr:ABC transporter permease [Acidipila sp.]
METLLQDLRFAVRMLRKNIGFTAIAVLTLALGIGANTAIFSVVNAVLLRPLPYPEPNRLVFLRETLRESTSSVAYPNFLDWREQSRTFASMGASRVDSFNLTQSGEAERLPGRMISAGWLETIGIPPALGRPIAAADDQAGASPVVMISYSLWQRRFGGDAAIVGKTIWLNGLSHTVIAVLPKTFRHYSFAPVDVFVPIGLELSDARERQNHPGISVLARLKPGATVEQAHAEMNTIAARLEKQYPDTNHQRGISITPMRENILGDVQPALLVLLAAVALVLLIACANVSNLLLARATARQREITIRRALGASPARLIRQFLTESVLLSLAGGALGVLLASWTLQALHAFPPANIPRVDEIHLDGSVLGFVLLLSMFTGILFGLVPALKSAAMDLAGSLKGASGQSTGTRTHQRLRHILVVSEFALTLMLLVGAGLLVKSFATLRGIDPGYDPRGLLTVGVSLPEMKYQGRKPLDFYEDVRQRAAALPGVEAVAYTNDMPFVTDDEEPFHVDGQPLPKQGEFPFALEYITSPSYFAAMKTRLVEGRFYNETDTAATVPVIVIDENLASKFYQGKAVGKYLRLSHDDTTPPYQIIGVAGHAAHTSLDGPQPSPYQMYLPYQQIPETFLYQAGRAMSLLIRAKGDPMNLAPAVRTLVRGIDADLPLYDIQTMESVVADSIAPDRFSAILLGAFAAVALLLAAAGLYGVISYSVSQRTQEIGIRMALGAKSESVLRLVLGEGLKLATTGLALGLVGSLALTRLIASQLHGVRAADPATFIGVALLLAATALAACYVPARRAMRVDPMVALRHE